MTQPSAHPSTPHYHPLLLVFIVIISAGLLLILPSDVSRLLFTSGIAGGLGYGTWKLAPRLSHAITHSRAVLWMLARRDRLAPRFGLLAVFAMAGSAIVFQQGVDFDTLNHGLLWLGIGAVCLWLALWLKRALPPVAHANISPLRRVRPYSRPLLFGLVGMFILAETNANELNLPLIGGVSHHVQMLLLVALLALLIWGGWRATTAEKSPRVPYFPRADWLPLLLIMGGAFILRVIGLDTTIRVLVDEIHFTDGILKYWSGERVPLLSSIGGLSPFTQVFTYWQAASVDVIGRTFTGFRLPSAIIGTMTIPALYLLARALFDRKTALLAALFLATFPPHLHFSRLGLIQIADALFGTAALAFLARAVVYNRRLDYVLGGIALGLTQYFYEGGRLFFPPLVLLWLMGGLWLWRPRPDWRGMLLAGFVFCSVALPVYYVILAEDRPLTMRLDASGDVADYGGRLRDPERLDNYIHHHLLRAARIHINIPPDDIYYRSEAPLLLLYAAPFFLLGIGVSLWHWRTPAVLLVVWLVANIFGNSLLQQSAWASRFLGVMPLLPLLVAVGLRTMLTFIQPGRGRTVGLVALALVMTVGQATYYFHANLPYFNRTLRQNALDPDDAILRATQLPPRTIAVIIGDINHRYYGGMFYFFTDDVHLLIISPSDLTDEYLAGLSHDTNYAFFFAPGDNETFGKISRNFNLDAPVFSDNPDVPYASGYIMVFARADRNRDHPAVRDRP